MYQRVAAREAPVKLMIGAALVSFAVLATYANTIEAASGRMETTLLHVVDLDGQAVLVRKVDHTAAELDRGADQDEHQVDPAVPEEIAEDLPGLLSQTGAAQAEEEKADDTDDDNPPKPELTGDPTKPVEEEIQF